MTTEPSAPAKGSTSPMLIIAAVAVVIFSATGTAAIMGWLPTSFGSPAETVAATAPVVPTAPAASKPRASSRPAPKAEPLPAVVMAPECSDCGVIESIRTDTQRGDGSGLGAVGGAVVGGLLGTQVGGGSGKKVATVAGAVGGAVAGHQIEKSIKSATSYEITVRLDDGSSRVINSTTAPGWRAGDKVKIIDGQVVAL